MGVGRQMALWVHPRIRGEYSPASRLSPSAAGSPPHTRGILQSECQHFCTNRFTPAYAGNTFSQFLGYGSQKVHPRIRGEYTCGKWTTCPPVGSPPHTRGILPNSPRILSQTWFTPAYAGNTHDRRQILKAQGVHPRIRGEYIRSSNQSSPTRGSPPHTRGILRYLLQCLVIARFTPAYAGNTNTYQCNRKLYEVHPRIRGEYCPSVRLTELVRGSPPHTRGILLFSVRFAASNRFTPAYAGNTLQLLRRQSTDWVHPRIRGEYCWRRVRALPISGSPPHTRGILV